MKKAVIISLMIFAMFSLVSCSDDTEDYIEAGGSCSTAGTESCSKDGSQILICIDSSWQIKRTCNVNFGQYCNQAANGSLTCSSADNSSSSSDDSYNSGNSGDNNNNNGGDSTDNGDSGNDEEDNSTNDSDSTDDGGNSANDEDSNNSGNDSDTNNNNNDNDNDTDTNDNDSSDSSTQLLAPGDCADIMSCMNTCGENDSTCQQNCYNNGTTAGKNQFYAWQTCNEDNSCGYYYDCVRNKCRDEDSLCGLAGDTANYKIPYGKVIVNGTFKYLHDENEADVYVSNCIEGGFASGTFGNNANIVDTSKYPLAYAQLVTNPEDSTDKRIILFQGHNDTTATAPIVRMLIKTTTAGTYTFGLGEFKEEKVRLFVSEQDGSCDHAFGYGSVTLSAINYTPGNTTITVNGEIDLYSYKAMPYYGGDISDNEYWIACPAK